MFKRVENNGIISVNDNVEGYGGSLHMFNVLGDVDCSEESSPLGLTLTKTPHLMNQIEMKLSQYVYGKLKVANFPATLLRIGTWEMVSKHECHIIAKCNYARRKFVWEILEGGLKYKFEIQWSDIIGIRATIRDNAPGVLEIELNARPLFFRENNPQPRKHTQWEPSFDFTEGHASIWRRHYLRFSPGILDKHYETILQCDKRLYFMSQRAFPSQESPCFELSKFFINGNGQGFHHGLPHPQEIHATHLPNHVQNFERATNHRGTFTETGSLMSGRDFPHMNETRTNYEFEQHRTALSVANVARQNYVQVSPPSSIASERQVQDNHLLNNVENEGVESPNPNNIIISDDMDDFDSQVSGYDEEEVLARVLSMTSLLELLEDGNPHDANNFSQSEVAINSSPPSQSSEHVSTMTRTASMDDLHSLCDSFLDTTYDDFQW